MEDSIRSYLALTPVPSLATAFSAFRFISSSAEQVRAGKLQLRVLVQCIAQLLQAINAELCTERSVEAKTAVDLTNLRRLLDELKFFVQKQASSGLLQLIFTKDERTSAIEDYHRRIAVTANDFQIQSRLDLQLWQSLISDARFKDQEILNDHLNDLEANQNQLMEALEVQQNNMMALMVSLQRCLDQRSSCDRESQFLSHSLQLLSTTSGSQVRVEDWMITSLEVDLGQEIGAGGFGQVYKGTWHKMEVAVKVLKSESGVTPSSKAIRREVATWSKMRHPHILQFLGANVLDQKPFIVMPYMKNGNARDYIQDHPDCDRLKMIHHVSLGLVYLHSQNLVHGDLKAMNVLIDDSEKALLCDFGLSRVKADATSRSTAVVGGIGSRNWMAPEQLIGELPRNPCDIYAFGMTIYEIYTDEIPLGYISSVHFIELVVHQDARPGRPYPDEAPGLSDDVWQLAEKCWVKDPLKRPTANSVCDLVSRLRDAPVGTSAAPPLPTQVVPQPNLPLHPLRCSPPPSHSSPLKTDLPQPTESAGYLSFPVDPISINPNSSTQEPKLETSHNWARRSPKPHVIQHTEVIHSIAFSPSGEQIISGGYDGIVQVWDVKDGMCIPGLFQGISREITSVAYSADGRWVAAGYLDGSVQLWDAITGELVPIGSFLHTQVVRSVAFSPDGRWMISGSFDKTMQIWDLNTAQLIKEDNRRLMPYASGILGGLNTQELTSRTIRAHCRINSLAVSPDGQWIALGNPSSGVYVWDAATGSHVPSPFAARSVRPPPNTTHTSAPNPFAGHTNSIKSVSFSPDGKLIASGSSDDTIRVWDANTGIRISGPFEGHTGEVGSVAFSPNGQWIVSGSHDKTVRVWDVETAIHVFEPFCGHTSVVTSVAFSPDGRSVASGSRDWTIRVWPLG